MAEVGLPRLAHREAAVGDADVGSPVPELALWIVRGLALRLVGDQQLEHHGARLLGALAGALHHHAVARRADAGGGEDPLALDLDHAGAAVAVGAVAGLRRMAETGHLLPMTSRGLPDGTVGIPPDFLPVTRDSGDLRPGDGHQYS